MAFYYRKQISLGPFRVNLSNTVVGLSIDTDGLRTRTLHAKSLARFQATSSEKHFRDLEMHHIGKGTVLCAFILLPHITIAITAQFGFKPTPAKAPDLRVKVKEPWVTNETNLQIASIMPASHITDVAFTIVPWIESRYAVATYKRLKRVATHLGRP